MPVLTLRTAGPSSGCGSGRTSFRGCAISTRTCCCSKTATSCLATGSAAAQRCTPFPSAAASQGAAAAAPTCRRQRERHLPTTSTQGCWSSRRAARRRRRCGPPSPPRTWPRSPLPSRISSTATLRTTEGRPARGRRARGGRCPGASTRPRGCTRGTAASAGWGRSAFFTSRWPSRGTCATPATPASSGLTRSGTRPLRTRRACRAPRCGRCCRRRGRGRARAEACDHAPPCRSRRRLPSHGHAPQSGKCACPRHVTAGACPVRRVPPPAVVTS
mmetsp:Transcript_17076/g.55147  ORF Transcript_17076/g.55147 Transcript_17076/m.55147 type:complete len:274 (-) Transcript_17076:86-907(-)